MPSLAPRWHRYSDSITRDRKDYHGEIRQCGFDNGNICQHKSGFRLIETAVRGEQDLKRCQAVTANASFLRKQWL
jgi:hypothetical protein